MAQAKKKIEHNTPSGSIELEIVEAVAETNDNQPDVRNIYQRLAKAMGSVDYIQKDKPSGLKYSVVSHDAVTAKVRPALLEQGIVYHPLNLTYSQHGNRTDCSIDIKFINIDNPDDNIVVPTFGYGIDNQDKGPGKAISYAVKYALLKTLGLETGDDPDLDQDVVHQISEQDISTLKQLISDAGKDEVKFCEHYKIDKLSDLPPSDLENATSLLNKAVSILSKEEKANG